MRMLQILRGLCISVDAEGMPILQMFAKHAREALMEGSQKQSLVNRVRMFAGREARHRKHKVESHQEVRPPQTDVRTDTDASLEAQVASKLQELVARQRIVGAQVAVVQGGRLICDVAAGTLSTIDARPVVSTTRFPLMGATPGVAALAALRVLARHTSAEGRSAEQDSLPPAESALRTTLVRDVWPQFGGGSSNVTLADLLSHRAGVQDAFPASFTPKLLDDVAAMVQHFEQVSLPCARDPRYSYLLQAFIMSKLGDSMDGKDSLLHWIGDELGPLGLDIAAPAGRGGEAAVCRDLPELARVSMNEVDGGRTRRREMKAEPAKATQQPLQVGSVATRTLLEALARDPLVFDPLQANAAHGGSFRAGLSLGVSARSLATMFSSEALQMDLTALRALELAGMDPTAMGWMLTGGACQWTTGGLQVLQLQGCGRRSLLANRHGGFGVVCGFGPCVAHFPDLAPGGVTLAVMVNDVLRGREVAAELVTAALSGYGYAPSWVSIPMRVYIDLGRLAQSPEAQPLLQSFGGLQALKNSFDSSRASAAEPVAHPSRNGDAAGRARSSLLSNLGQWCASLCCCTCTLPSRRRSTERG